MRSSFVLTLVVHRSGSGVSLTCALLAGPGTSDDPNRLAEAKTGHATSQGHVIAPADALETMDHHRATGTAHVTVTRTRRRRSVIAAAGAAQGTRIANHRTRSRTGPTSRPSLPTNPLGAVAHVIGDHVRIRGLETTKKTSTGRTPDGAGAAAIARSAGRNLEKVRVQASAMIASGGALQVPPGGHGMMMPRKPRAKKRIRMATQSRPARRARLRSPLFPKNCARRFGRFLAMGHD